MKKGFKVLLILPHGPIHRFKTGTYKKALRYAPLTLATLGALIPEELEVELELVDEGTRTLEPDELEADLVGISVMTGTANRAYRIADLFRQKGSTVVLGGVHVTLMPEEAQQHADTVVLGLAEEEWPKLLRDYASGQLQPVYRQAEDFCYKNMPPPRRDLLDKKKYITSNTVQATRGCMNNCDFCAIATAWQRKMYFRPVPEVVAEIEALPGKEVLFLDPSPMENVAYSKDLYREMIPLKKRWAGCATTKLGEDDELLDLVAQSGCKGLLVGLESTNPATLKRVQKGFNHVEKYKEFIEKLHHRGIAIQGCFVFGIDDDEKDVFDRTVEFVYDTNVDLPQYSIYTPFPGTPAHRRLAEENRITETDWTLYDAEHVVFEPANMTKMELFDGLKRAWRESYTWGSIIKRLSMSRCLLPISIPANIGYRSYADKLPKYTDEFMVERNQALLVDAYDV